MNDSLLNNITISQTEAAHLPLIKRFLKENGFRAQAAKTDVIYTVRLNQTLIGALRLCHYSDSWLLRSMCIKESYRRMGIGLQLLLSIHSDLESKQCYCFSYQHLESFYHNAGFRRIDYHQATAIIHEMFCNYINQGKNIVLMQFSA